MIQREDLNYYLQKASAISRNKLCRNIETAARVTTIQQPTVQTLMLPISDPIDHGSFYCGEVLVTSAIMRVNTTNGWAMIMDEEPDIARQVAMLDAAFAANIMRSEILGLVGEGKLNYERETCRMAAKTKKTKVSFDLM